MKPHLTKEFAAGVAEGAVKRGASAAEVIIRQRTEFSVGVRLGEVETLQESTDQGLGLRVLIDGRQASVSGSDFSRDAVMSLVDEAVELARLTSPDDTAGLPDPEELAGSLRISTYGTKRSFGCHPKSRSRWRYEPSARRGRTAIRYRTLMAADSIQLTAR